MSARSLYTFPLFLFSLIYYSLSYVFLDAGVAQLVERHLLKVNVVSSNLITRFFAGFLIWTNYKLGALDFVFVIKVNAGVAQW